MSDFTSGFWSIYVAVLTVVSIVACGLLLQALSRRKVSGDPDKTGHVWDEDLDEYNNPLPRWWVWLFWITIVFSIAYLWLYPGLGSYEGAWKWTSAGQYGKEIEVAEHEVAPLYAKYEKAELMAIAMDADARVIGQKLFLNYCVQCHASDARGGKGFPNLTDDAWLYGGEIETIEKTIADGRTGVMPAWGPALGPEGVLDVANFVRSLSGLEHDKARAERGKATFQRNCVACHGPEGKGSKVVGAPDLTDQVWEYGSSEKMIAETITKGRNNRMPAHRELLGEARVKLLSAYVYSLSHPETRNRSLLPVGATAPK